MPSPKITEEQAVKQKEALKAFHDAKKSGAWTNLKAKRLSTCMKEMQTRAVEIIDKSLSGDKDVSKSQLDSAWKIVNSIMATQKAEQDNKIRKLQIELTSRKAEEAGILKPTQEKVKETFEEKGLQEVKSHFEFEEAWEDEIETSDEDDEEDSDNN